MNEKIRPASGRWRRALHRVARSEGPERIAPEWWRDGEAAATRDYFRVEDVDGRGLGRVGVADLRREHDRDTEVAAEGEHPGGMAQARGGAFGAAVTHRL